MPAFRRSVSRIYEEKNVFFIGALPDVRALCAAPSGSGGKQQSCAFEGK